MAWLLPFISFLILPLFVHGSTFEETHDVLPPWVKPIDFAVEYVPVKPSQVNLQCLLLDIQRNWEEKSFYRHFAGKVLTKNGVESISQLEIDFDPAYQSVIVHVLRIFREGQWWDRLETARSKVIQRESRLEDHLCDGEHTLVYLLNDIREGDIVESAYSINGSDPFRCTHYAELITLQAKDTVEKIVYRFVAHPDLSFFIKPTNTLVEPKIVDLRDSLREWYWEVYATEPYVYEPGQPIWHNPLAQIQMSQYRSWGEVVQKVLPLYVLPPNFEQTIPDDMQALVENWNSLPVDLSEKALYALRFVQDHIRYFGIEEGIGAFKPTDPLLTFQRRFGDCKDKSFLLHALLHLMGIRSTLLLVNTNYGKTLPDELATTSAFNHVVLQMEINNTNYFVDPVISLQGGSLQNNYFPDYGWGLLIDQNTTDLMKLPSVVYSRPTRIDTSYVVESEDVVQLKIERIYSDSRADRLRRLLTWNGVKEIEEGAYADIQEQYGAVTQLAPMEVIDDRDNNTITLRGSYRFWTQRQDDSAEIEIYSYILQNYLQKRINPGRSAPLEISYPLWIKEHIHVHNPFMEWEQECEKYEKNHASLLYSLNTNITKHDAAFDLELKHLRDHIALKDLRDYWKLTNAIDKKGVPSMTIALDSFVADK